METPLPFTVYELWKDFLSGDLRTVIERTIHVFQVPQECYTITFTFTLGVFIILGILARSYPMTTLHIVQHLLNISDHSLIPTLIVNLDERRSRARSRNRRDKLEETKKLEHAKRTTNITNEYKKFVPAVLNILGKDITPHRKLQQIMSKVEDLSMEAIIGYNWDKNVNKSIGALLEELYPDKVHRIGIVGNDFVSVRK